MTKHKNLLRAAKAYRAGRLTHISGDPRTITDDIETWRANQEMWQRHHRRAAMAPRDRTLDERYRTAIYAAASEFARATFGGRAAVSVVAGDRDDVAWLGGRAVVTISYTQGPKSTLASLQRSADDCLRLIPLIDRGLRQSLKFLSR